MQARQKQAIEAFQRVQDFLGAHPVPPPASYGEPKTLLDQVVQRLTDHTIVQVAGRRMSRAEVQRQKKLRSTLRELHLRPISKIARASLADVEAVGKALVMPASQLSTTALIGEALGIRDAVAPYGAQFVKYGRPEKFLEQLDAVIEALRQAQLGRARNVGRGVGAKEGLQEEIERGRDAVGMLDGIVTTAFAANPDVLARWRVASRIQALPGGGVSAAGGAEENAVPPQAAA
jgi:hypothetical protein